MFVLLAILLSLRAHAQEALAVTPLSRAAASEKYDGLGKALAGMLVSDLSTVPAIRLVERDRLDAVLAEIKLAESGYLDPATAQKLGKGVGAALVVTGSFSVIEETFVVDARIVRVATGEIVKAADASGKASDFVAVEKELVDELLDGLAIQLGSAERRKLMLQAPTEQFGAFAAYGEGLARQGEGNVDAARQAFQKAVEADPQFAEARAALDGLSAMVAGEKQAQIAAAKQIADQRHARVLADAPDERTRPNGFVDDTPSLAMFALRLAVLESEGRDCDRHAEMLHYLDRVGWAIADPPRGEYVGVFTYQIGQFAEKYGLNAYTPHADLPERLREPVGQRAQKIWYRGSRWFVPENWRHPESSLYDSLRACFSPADRLREIDRVVAKLEKVAVGQTKAVRGNISLVEWYRLAWTRERATHFGANDELNRRTAALLAARTGDDVLREVEDVVRIADRWSKLDAMRVHQTEATLVAYMRALATGDAKVLRLEAPLCSMVFQDGRTMAPEWVARYEQGLAEGSGWVPDHVAMVGWRWAVARDLGCQSAFPARFRSFDEVLAFVAGGEARMRPEKKSDPDCARALAQSKLGESGRSIVQQDPKAAGTMSNHALLLYYPLVTHRCVVE